VLTEAGPRIERVDLFNYGEPFLYRHLIEALRHLRRVMPATEVTVSTDGMQVRPGIEEAIVAERLLDWVIFSVDGADADSYRRYRVRGDFDARDAGIPIWFDFAHTWGRSRRRPEQLRYLTPYLRPFTALPGEQRQGGW
jgi:hypothetical protein